jgi:hypothetical protein
MRSRTEKASPHRRFLSATTNSRSLRDLRNGSRNIFVCFVLGEVCIPAIFFSAILRTRSFLATNPVAYFLLLYLQRQPIPACPFISILRDDLRTRHYLSIRACRGRFYLGNSRVPISASSKSCKKPNVGRTRTKETFEYRSSIRRSNWL